LSVSLFSYLTSLYILEDSYFLVLFNLNKLEAILDWYTSLLELTFNKLICFSKVFNKSVISVDYGEITIFPAELSVEIEPIPNLFR
jgi:hypothetical protein